MYTLYVVLLKKLTFRVSVVLRSCAHGWRIRYVAASRYTHTAEIRPGRGGSLSICRESGMISMSVYVCGVCTWVLYVCTCEILQYLYH